MLAKPEVIQLLSHATVFACPSLYEPLGIVNLEATVSFSVHAWRGEAVGDAAATSGTGPSSTGPSTGPSSTGPSSTGTSGAGSTFRLMYRSRNTIPADQRKAELGTLFAAARSNNKKQQITGALLIYGDWFAQVPEGAEAPVRALFATIEQDPRHENISVIQSGRPASGCSPGGRWPGFPRTVSRTSGSSRIRTGSPRP